VWGFASARSEELLAGQLSERWATAMNENPAPGGIADPFLMVKFFYFQ